MLKLTPVAMMTHGPAYAWAPDYRLEEWVELTGQARDADVANAVAALAWYGDEAEGATLEKVLLAMMAGESRVLAGGLRAERDGVVIGPSCCCGLENWRQWFRVKPGGASPWLGHDPNPHVECADDRAIIHADDAPGAQTIVVDYAELSAARVAADAAFTDFIRRLQDWLARHAPGAAGFADWFVELFDISPPLDD
ncbi:MAG: hypothetical protein QM608_07900 [Caulobacter sp.]